MRDWSIAGSACPASSRPPREPQQRPGSSRPSRARALGYGDAEVLGDSFCPRGMPRGRQALHMSPAARRRPPSARPPPCLVGPTWHAGQFVVTISPQVPPRWTSVAPVGTMGGMALSSGASSFHLGPKGRVVLPAAVRRAAGIPDGAQVIARAIGPGRIVIETIDAVRDRVWSASSDSAGVDSTDIRALREEDINTADRAAQARSRVEDDTTESDAVGLSLLAHLGL